MTMLYYKAWRETRSRFLIGLAVLVGTTVFIVMEYQNIAKLLLLVPGLEVGGEVQRKIIEAADISHTYRGYVWSQLFTKNLPQAWCLFAAILGAGGLISSRWSRGMVYTLSLPLSRRVLVLTRAAVVATELLAMALIPSLLVCVVSPFVGQSYGVTEALVHGLCMFAGGSIFFGLAFLLSSFFEDWRPIMFTAGLAIALSALEDLFPWYADHGLFQVVSGASYFRGGGLPWLGLAITLGTTTAMVYGAVLNVARRDF
jgi:ABC-2 type transport system permease protein